MLAFDYRLSVAARAAPPAGALAAVDTLQASGPTALRDALYAALELTRSATGRRVVLVFTDGTDTLSYLGEVELLREARESEVSVYAVRGGSGDHGPRLEAGPVAQGVGAGSDRLGQARVESGRQGGGIG